MYGEIAEQFCRKRRLDFHYVEKERSLENITGGSEFPVVISPDEQVQYMKIYELIIIADIR